MEIVLTEGFRTDLREMVTSEKVFDHIMKIVYEVLPIIPTLGNSDLPTSIAEIFGPSVSRAYAKPFFVIYEYSRSDQRLTVYGLIHEKQAC